MSIDYESIAYIGIDMSYDTLFELISKYSKYDVNDGEATSYFMDDFYNNVWQWNYFIDDNYDDSYSIGIILSDHIKLEELLHVVANAEHDYWYVIAKMFPDMPDDVKYKTMTPYFGVKLSVS